MSLELISKKTRTEFCEHLVGWTLRTIRNEFDSADIACDEGFEPGVGGDRRTLVLQYYNTLDFTNPADVRKLHVAFEGVLNADMERAERLEEFDPNSIEAIRLRSAVERLCKLLRRDGYQYECGRIVPISPTASLHLLKETAVVFDGAYLSDQVRRLEQSVESDPTHAIGASKELVETCCHTILSERAKPVTDKPDLLPLVRRTLEELKLVPDGIPDTQKGAKSIKSLLGNLASMTQSLAELRNLYGTGHGKDGRRKGLTTRHARLAVGAATTLAVFLFDTHHERDGAT